MQPKFARGILLGLALMTLIVTRCTGSPALHAAPDLGVMTDADFKVVDLLPSGPALAAGVQVGDVLLDLTWIPSDARVVLPPPDIVYVDPGGFMVDPMGNPYVDATGRRLTLEEASGAPGPPRPREGGAVQSSPLPTPTPILTPTVVQPISVLVLPGNRPYQPPVGPRAADVIEKDTVSFTAENTRRIHGLAAYGVPLKLRIQRGDQVMELTITPTDPASRYVEPPPGAPTPTPISSAHYF